MIFVLFSSICTSGQWYISKLNNRNRFRVVCYLKVLVSQRILFSVWILLQCVTILHRYPQYDN